MLLRRMKQFQNHAQKGARPAQIKYQDKLGMLPLDGQVKKLCIILNALPAVE